MSIFMPNAFLQFQGAEAVNFTTGTFTKSTSGAPAVQAVTGIGFIPKVLILYSVERTVETTPDSHEVLCHGFSDGTNSNSVFAGSQTGVMTTDCFRYSNSSKLLTIRNGTSGALQSECDLTTFDADGFTVTWTTNSANATLVKFIAIGGDITAEVGSFISPNATTGVQNIATGITNADFTMITSVGDSTEDSIGQHCLLSMGVASSAANQGHTNISSQDGQPTSLTRRYQRTNQIVSRLSINASSTIEEGEFDGHTINGFDINWTKSNATQFFHHYLTIKGAQWEVGNGTTPTSTGTKAFTTAFQPKGLGALSVVNTVSAVVNTQNQFHCGSSDGTDDASMAGYDENGLMTTDARRLGASDMCYESLALTNATLEEANIKTGGSFNATDFTLDFTKVDGAAIEFVWFVCGDLP